MVLNLPWFVVPFLKFSRLSIPMAPCSAIKFSVGISFIMATTVFSGYWLVTANKNCTRGPRGEWRIPGMNSKKNKQNETMSRNSKLYFQYVTCKDSKLYKNSQLKFSQAYIINSNFAETLQAFKFFSTNYARCWQ